MFRRVVMGAAIGLAALTVACAPPPAELVPPQLLRVDASYRLRRPRRHHRTGPEPVRVLAHRRRPGLLRAFLRGPPAAGRQRRPDPTPGDRGPLRADVPDLASGHTPARTVRRSTAASSPSRTVGTTSSTGGRVATAVAVAHGSNSWAIAPAIEAVASDAPLAPRPLAAPVGQPPPTLGAGSGARCARRRHRWRGAPPRPAMSGVRTTHRRSRSHPRPGVGGRVRGWSRRWRQ